MSNLVAIAARLRIPYSCTQSICDKLIHALIASSSVSSPAIISSPSLSTHLSQPVQCRILGLDIGDRYIGVAVTDELCKAVYPVTTLNRLVSISNPHYPVHCHHQHLVDHEIHTPSSMPGRERRQADRNRQNKTRTPVKRTEGRSRFKGPTVAFRPSLVYSTLCRYLYSYRCTALAVGWPIDLQAEQNERTDKTKEFIQGFYDFAQTYSYEADQYRELVPIPCQSIYIERSVERIEA